MSLFVADPLRFRQWDSGAQGAFSVGPSLERFLNQLGWPRPKEAAAADAVHAGAGQPLPWVPSSLPPASPPYLLAPGRDGPAQQNLSNTLRSFSIPPGRPKPLKPRKRRPQQTVDAFEASATSTGLGDVMRRRDARRRPSVGADASEASAASAGLADVLNGGTRGVGRLSGQPSTRLT